MDAVNDQSTYYSLFNKKNLVNENSFEFIFLPLLNLIKFESKILNRHFIFVEVPPNKKQNLKNKKIGI